MNISNIKYQLECDLLAILDKNEYYWFWNTNTFVVINNNNPEDKFTQDISGDAYRLVLNAVEVILGPEAEELLMINKTISELIKE